MQATTTAGLALIALVVAGCSAVGSMMTPDILEGDASKSPFIDVAMLRVAQKSAPEDGKPQSSPAAMPRPSNSPARSYSGVPDGVSFSEIYKKGGVIHTSRVQAYMHKVLDRVLTQWPYEVDRLGIFVVNHEGFDAQATAAGDILITSGMLMQLESEDELAAVLGHEVSHILLRHHERAEQTADNKRALNGAASAAVTYLMFSNTDWVKTGKNSYQGTVNTGSWVTQSAQAGGACLAASYMIDKFFDPGWSRTQEDEADLLGIDLMIKAGYNPNAALQAMRRRVEYEGKTHKTIVEKRQEEGVYDNMVSNAVEKNGIAGIFTGAAQSISAGVIDTFSDVDNYLAQTHRMSSDRLNTMQLYLDRHYPLRERQPLMADSYANVMKSKTVAKTLENHRAASQASAAVLKNDLDAALRLAKSSITPPTANELGPRFSMYMVLSAMGKEPEAFDQLLKVKNLDTAPPQFFVALADGYARRGRADLAEQMRQRAEARAHSIYDDKKDKSGGDNFLQSLLAPQPKGGANRFEVTGYCETLRSAVTGSASMIAEREL